MRALAIDTSTHRASVALWEGGACAAREIHLDPARHAEALIGLLDRAFAAAGWSRSQIDLVACGLGPGSFTGVRVGLSTAKGVALALDRPIVGVGSLEAMAAPVCAGRAEMKPGPGVVVAPLLDARKGEIFWALYDARGEAIGEPRHVAATHLGSALEPHREGGLIAVGEIAATLALPGVQVVRGAATDLPDAAEIARLALDKLARRGPDDLHALEPVYVRPPDITAPRPTAAR